MEASKTCECKRPDLRNLDDRCLGCGHIISNAASNGSLHEMTCNERYESFKYRPLRSDSSFRLVRVYAGRHEDDITCQIFHSTLSDHPLFEALSYTWGEMTRSHKFFSTEGIVSITANCEAALRDLRYSFRDRILWIDALCIDQENNEEKNKQVPLMSRVYNVARRVVIYVGSDRRPDLDRFFAYLRRSEPSNCAKDRVTQAAVSSFLSIPWFSRVWILQEVAVAKDALLMWGTATLDWKYFSAAHLNTLQLMPVDRSGKVPPVLLFTEDDTKPMKDLVSLVHTARSCNSTEPRDKIYALLGLLDHVQHTLKPDYRKPIGLIQSELVMDIVKSYNHLDILALANTETRGEALSARKLAAKVGGMGSGASFAENHIGDAAKKLAQAEKSAGVEIAHLLEAEKDERHTWARLRYLETAWHQVQEAEDVWQEQHERYEAVKDVQVEFVAWVASMDMQGRKWFWQKGKDVSHCQQLQETRKVAFRDAVAKESATWEKWNGMRKARWKLAKTEAEESWIEMKATEEQERRELEIMEMEWLELQEEERLFGVSTGIDIAGQKYRRKDETWREMKAMVDKQRSEIDQEEMKEQEYLKSETAKRRVFEDTMLALNEVLSQNKTTVDAEIMKTFIRNHQPEIEGFARGLLEKRKRAKQKVNKERKLWYEASQLKLLDDPKKPLHEAKKAWHEGKEKTEKARNDPLVIQFNKASRRYEMLRRERSSYASEIQRMISKELHSEVRFSTYQDRKATSQGLPSWVPGLDDHQYLTSLACFRHREGEYSEIVARSCALYHGHTPGLALQIKILELDTIRTDRIPEVGSMKVDDFRPSNFGRAFQNTNSLPDKPWGTEREDFLSRLQQNYQSETRGSAFSQIQTFCQGRRRMLTEKSWVICSGQVKMSDMVCAIYGASVPFVLRPRVDGQVFDLIGECYLEGFLGPKFADDYLDLLGRFRQYFGASTSENLPWKTVCLE